MAGREFDLRLDTAAVADLAADADAQDLAQDAGDVVADIAAGFAPKDSGVGAASIHAEVDVDEISAYADISWDKDHFYMGFKELGTEHEPAQPFLRPALDSSSI